MSTPNSPIGEAAPRPGGEASVLVIVILVAAEAVAAGAGMVLLAVGVRQADRGYLGDLPATWPTGFSRRVLGLYVSGGREPGEDATRTGAWVAR